MIPLSAGPDVAEPGKVKGEFLGAAGVQLCPLEPAPNPSRLCRAQEDDGWAAGLAM